MGGSPFRAFFSELRRRRVIRVAAVYAVVAYGVLEVADIVLPALSLPEWGITLTVALVVLGFPVAMVLAWAFDITPQGVRRTEPLAGHVVEGETPNRAMALSAVALVLMLTFAAGWYLLPRLPGRGTDTSNKVAVLPFQNLGNPSDEYFADGITEEITARLASIQGLGVIARTSAIRYEGTDKTVQQIGEELGVDYVLEGTVRWEETAGGSSRVRVTPQLIRVADATHVWAEIYEKPMSSVFEVQSEIAERVARAMDVTVREPEREDLKREPTKNSEAYEYFLRGQQYLIGSGETGALQALEMFEQAIELDPNFREALEKLAETHANHYWGSFRIHLGVRGESYEETLDRLSLDSFGADTQSYYLLKAILLRRMGQRDSARAYFDSAKRVIDRRLEARPTESRLHAQLGLALAGLGNEEAAIREGRAALDLSPTPRESFATSALVDNLAHIYVLVGEQQAALQQIRSLLSSDSPMSAAWLKVDPTWDPLRGNSGFADLVEEVS